MIDTEGWKNPDKEMPKEDIYVLCCCPSDPMYCFKVLTCRYC